ncbi:hypothetical protein Tco_1244320, partial [Tanacetum coccineum]
FSHDSYHFSGDSDIYFGFVDNLWEDEGDRGCGREEINDGDKLSPREFEGGCLYHSWVLSDG